jgi:hypothetical protein
VRRVNQGREPGALSWVAMGLGVLAVLSRVAGTFAPKGSVRR